MLSNSVGGRNWTPFIVNYFFDIPKTTVVFPIVLYEVMLRYNVRKPKRVPPESRSVRRHKRAVKRFVSLL